MAVIIEDRLIGRVGAVEMFCGLVVQEKVFSEEWHAGW
jgi:hypothetical protein